MFFLTQAALPHLKKSNQPRIINTSSVTAYRGSGKLIDYAATKGTIVAFTRSLSQNLAGSGILVNGVAPGPVWTPLIPATFPNDTVPSFGTDAPLGRAGEPSEVAPAYVYLASRDAAYVTGQFIHINGGEIVNG
jgi:NAD(P)-dependent dehydrogenase (short-subunit alcohol dehydrogenase family)